MMMRYLSVCSGMEAASIAWAALNWRPLAFSEIEAAPRALLRQRFPDVPLHGDFTALRDEQWIVDADVLVGGTPCQGFSFAGLRGSLSDDRSNLCLEFIRLANAIDDLRRAARREPAWILWENVPGVFSTNDNAFGAFLGGLVGSDAPITPRSRWTDSGVVVGPRRCAAWRCLDAQFFGLAQRRKRIFVLAIEHPRGWAAPDALLPITESLRWHPAPRRETREGVAPTLAARARGGGGLGTDAEIDGALIPETSHTLKGHHARSDGEGETFVAHTHPIGFDAYNQDETGDVSHTITVGGETPIGFIPFDSTQLTNPNSLSNPRPGDPCHTLSADAHPPAIAFSCKDHGQDSGDDIAHTLLGKENSSHDHTMETYVAHSLRADGFDASEDGTGRGTPLVPIAFMSNESFDSGENVDVSPSLRIASNGGGQPPAIAFSCKDHGADAGELAPTLRAMGHDGSHANAGGQLAVAFDARQSDVIQYGDMSGPLDTNQQSIGVLTEWAVRRLTPRECERLQGAPDDWTLVQYRGKPMADGPRYKMIGNSMAVPVMRWIGERIDQISKQWKERG